RICSDPTRSTTISHLFSSSGLRGDNNLVKSRRFCYQQHLNSNIFSKASWRQISKVLAFSLQIRFNKICFSQGESPDRLSTVQLHPPALPSIIYTVYAFWFCSGATFDSPEKLPSSYASRNLNNCRQEV
ncbi:unnamed protein product, partial [Brassica napus]